MIAVKSLCLALIGTIAIGALVLARRTPHDIPPTQISKHPGDALVAIPPLSAAAGPHRALAAQRATMDVLRRTLGSTESPVIDIALFGSLFSYVEPCACSSRARTGGLASIAGAVNAWREVRYPTSLLVDVGDSLLRHGENKDALGPLQRDKFMLVAGAYRQMGVTVSCPGPHDLRAFASLAAWEEFAAATKASIVVTNSQSASPHVTRSHTVRRDGDACCTIVSLVAPDDAQDAASFLALRPWRDGVAALSALCAESPVVLCVVHGIVLDDVIGALDEDIITKVLLVAVDEPRAHTVTGPRAGLAASDRVIRPAARGQTVDFVCLSGDAEDRGTVLQGTASQNVLLEIHRHSNEPLDSDRLLSGLVQPVGALFAHYQLHLNRVTESALGRDEALVAAIRAYDAKVVAHLRALPLYDDTSVPDKWRLLLPSACESCHQDQVRSWRVRDPHRRAVATLERTTERPLAVACYNCHLSGFRNYSVDSSTEPDVQDLMRMRAAVGGITCVTCHGNVTGAHPNGTMRARARATCVECHDSINSPTFDYRYAVQHMGCCVAGD